jgi:hypothetical protein
MKGCSKSIGSPEPRWMGARSLMMATIKAVPPVPQVRPRARLRWREKIDSS